MQNIHNSEKYLFLYNTSDMICNYHISPNLFPLRDKTSSLLYKQDIHHKTLHMQEFVLHSV